MDGSILYRLKNLIDHNVISIEKTQFKIGRAPTNDLAIENNRYISSVHCIFEYDNRHVYIRDTSSNGTLINRIKKINKNENPIELQAGDIIHLVFRKDEPSANLIFQLDLPSQSKNKRKLDDCQMESEFKRLKANEDLSHQARDEMEDILTCLCCQEIMSNPICLEPCLHAFCNGCYQTWERIQRTCPKCRVQVTSKKKNVVINGILEAFFKAYPERKPVLTAIENQSSNMNSMISTNNQDEDEDDDDELEDDDEDDDDRDEDDEDEDDDDDRDDEDDDEEDEVDSDENEEDVVLFMPTPIPDVQFHCQQCPPNRFVRRTIPADYHCRPGDKHILCQCCTKAMPDRRTQANVHQNCEICHQFFCNLYYEQCTRNGCLGCLNQLKRIEFDVEKKIPKENRGYLDMNFAPRHLTNFVNDNQVETQILRNYLAKYRLSISDLLLICCQRLDRKEFKSSTIDPATLVPSTKNVCYKCSLNIFKDLAYQFRVSMKKSDILPTNLRNREDCYYGKQCRTQHTKVAHAQKYNHACNQIKFE